MESVNLVVCVVVLSTGLFLSHEYTQILIKDFPIELVQRKYKYQVVTLKISEKICTEKKEQTIHFDGYEITSI